MMRDRFARDWRVIDKEDRVRSLRKAKTILPGDSHSVKSFAISPFAYRVLVRAIHESAAGRDLTPEESKVQKTITLLDIKRYIETTSDWRTRVRLTEGCDPVAFLEIERFAKENGIAVGISQADPRYLENSLSLRASNAMRMVTHSDMPTISMLREFIDTHPDWRFIIFATINCGRKTLREIDYFAFDEGIIRQPIQDWSKFQKEAIRKKLY
jgi:hypothetical protein